MFCNEDKEAKSPGPGVNLVPEIIYGKKVSYSIAIFLLIARIEMIIWSKSSLLFKKIIYERHFFDKIEPT